MKMSTSTLWLKAVTIILVLGMVLGTAFWILYPKVFPTNEVETNKVEISTYVVQSDEIVVLQNTLTDELTYHTFGDTLKVDEYRKVTSYPKSTIIKFFGGDDSWLTQQSIQDSTLVEF